MDNKVHSGQDKERNEMAIDGYQIEESAQQWRLLVK